MRPSRFAGLQSQESQEIDPLSPIAYSRHTSQPATRVIKAWPMPTSARGLAANRANPRRSRAQNPKGKARLPGRAPRSPCRAGSPPLERGASRGRNTCAKRTHHGTHPLRQPSEDTGPVPDPPFQNSITNPLGRTAASLCGVRSRCPPPSRPRRMVGFEAGMVDIGRCGSE